MKKILLVIVSLLLLTSCGSKKIEEKEIVKEPSLAEDEVVLRDVKYKLDQETTEYGIKFKIANNFRKTDTGNAINYFSEKVDGQSYFVIRLFHYKNKNIDYAIDDTTISYDNKYETKIGDKDYTVVHFVNPTNTGDETKIYYYKHNNDTYAYCFTAKIDLSRLEEVFLKQIIYE